MAIFRLIFNIAWFVLGGFVMGLAWWLAGILCFISIIGIPFGIQHLKLALLSLTPIGQTVVPTEQY